MTNKKIDRLSPPRPKRELIESGAYCNKDHKDRDLPPKDDHIENDHVYCDWCPYYTMCDESVYYKEELEKEVEEEKSIKQEDNKIIEWEHNPSLANNLMREDLL